ncbi:MAG TPA: hypothetical protein PLL69_01970 [Gemmatimonadales bacterium]|nr:hypothetical protein [Gemmatimonadales bacterium]
MNACIRLDSMLESYLAGQASEAESEWLENHAGECERCAAIVAPATDLALPLSRVMAPPVTVRAAVLARIDAGRRRRWFVPAAIAAGLALTFMLVRPEPKQGEVPQRRNLSAAIAADRAAHDLGVLDAALAELGRALADSPGNQGITEALGRLESQRRFLESLVLEFES